MEDKHSFTLTTDQYCKWKTNIHSPWQQISTVSGRQTFIHLNNRSVLNVCLPLTVLICCQGEWMFVFHLQYWSVVKVNECLSSTYSTDLLSRVLQVEDTTFTHTDVTLCLSLTLPALMTLISILWHCLVLNCSAWNCILHPNLLSVL